MVNDSDATLDAAFAALADPTRRAILRRLARHGATVGELAAPFAMSLPAVSKHLRVLERAGLVARRVDGRVHRIGIVPGPLRTVEQWLSEHRSFWEERLDALARWLETDASQEEETPCPRPEAPRTPRSASNARSRRHARRSGPRGRGPRR